MSNEASREAFESWCKSVRYSTSPDISDKRLYWYAETSSAWDAWQAALAQQVGVLIPMPESQIDALSDKHLLAGAHDCVLGVVEFVRAIEAHHGIGSKP